MIYLTDPTSHKHNSEIQNIGDIIIKDAVTDNFPGQLRENTWVPIDFARNDTRLQDNSYLVLAGANILANKAWFNPFVWRPAGRHLFKSKFLILFGVGWWQYQNDPDFLTRWFYNKYLLNGDAFHSVRDGYTKSMLEKAGIPNVINTGCPTMWKLPDSFDFKGKKDSVVFTITDYNRDYENDKVMIRILLEEYKNVIFFPQGAEDIEYLDQLVTPEEKKKIKVLSRDIADFNNTLKSGVDYVGTRLHAGIRALQYGVRAVIVSVDNRAIEIARDTGIMIIARKEIANLAAILNEKFTLDLTINRKGISDFKAWLKGFAEKR
jgi:hypothetical protein